MTMRRFFAILLLLTMIPLANAGGGKAPQKTPAARTREFLDAYGHDIALQDIKRIDKMRAFLSKELYAALRAARIEQETFVATHPGDKPGLVEMGFNSGEENEFDSYAVGLTNMLAKNRAAVDVGFVENSEEIPIRWKDRYEWVLEGSTWKLDDIVFRSEGRRSPRERRLKTLLRSH
jgi:hypothetical protein